MYSIGHMVGVALSELSSAALVYSTAVRGLAARAPDGKRTRNLPYFLFSHMHYNHERAHTGHFVWDMARIEPRKRGLHPTGAPPITLYSGMRI